MRRRRAVTAIAIVLGVVIVGQALGVWKLVPMPMHAIDANEHSLQAPWTTVELVDDQLKFDVSMPGILGEYVQPVSTYRGNRVYLYNDVHGGTVLYGSADADIARVTVDRDAAVGGKVVDGTWIVYVDGVRSGLPVTWSFVRADGSVALQGAGYHDDPAAPGGSPAEPAPIEHYEMPGCYMEPFTLMLRATATGFETDVNGMTTRIRFPHTYAARMGAGGVVEVLGSDGHVVATTGAPASFLGGGMDPFDAC